MPRNNGNAPKRSVAQPATRTDLSYLRIERKYSRFIRAMKFTLIDFGDTASHSRVHRTVTKSFTVHRLDHFHHALFPFRLALREQCELRDFRTREKGARTVWTSCDARSTTNARSGIHRQFRSLFWNRNSVSFRCASVETET